MFVLSDLIITLELFTHTQVSSLYSRPGPQQFFLKYRPHTELDHELPNPTFFKHGTGQGPLREYVMSSRKHRE